MEQKQKLNLEFLRTFTTELEKFFRENENQGKVTDFLQPKELFKKFDFDPTKKFKNDEELFESFENIMHYSVKTYKKMFLNQLFSGTDHISAVADLMGSILNTSLATYEISPVFTLMEQTTLKRFQEIFHFEEGGSFFNPGGSMSNISSIHAARFNFDDKINQNGNGSNIFRIYTSKDSHYSFSKGAMLLGIGVNNVVKIETSGGKMDPKDLEERIKQDLENNKTPLMVACTGGTTVLGKFDKIDEIVDVAKKYKLWTHVDACWGGGVMFTQKYKSRLNGIEKVDSLAFNPHKSLRVSEQCSVLFIRDKQIFDKMFSLSVNYLFQNDKELIYDTSLDSGRKYLYCGRKNDILKLWLSLKVRGEEQISKDIEKSMENCLEFADLIKKNSNFKLIDEDPEYLNISFQYVPKKELNEDQMRKLYPLIKKEMLLHGEMMVNYQPLNSGGLQNFFRIILIREDLQTKDLERVIELFEQFGEKVINNLTEIKE
eukprot:gene5953-9781_t